MYFFTRHVPREKNMETCTTCKHTGPVPCKYCRKKRCRPCGVVDCEFCNANTLVAVPGLLWSDKNTVEARTVWKNSYEKVWITCAGCERDVQQIAARIGKFKCALCKSKTELKLYKYLRSLYKTEAQVKFAWSPSHIYDFLVNDTIIVELDGSQHFAPIAHWKSGWEVAHTDVVKEKLALEHEHPMIRLLQTFVYDDGASSAPLSDTSHVFRRHSHAIARV